MFEPRLTVVKSVGIIQSSATQLAIPFHMSFGYFQIATQILPPSGKPNHTILTKLALHQMVDCQVWYTWYN